MAEQQSFTNAELKVLFEDAVKAGEPDKAERILEFAKNQRAQEAQAAKPEPSEAPSTGPAVQAALREEPVVEVEDPQLVREREQRVQNADDTFAAEEALALAGTEDTTAAELRERRFRRTEAKFEALGVLNPTSAKDFAVSVGEGLMSETFLEGSGAIAGAEIGAKAGFRVHPVVGPLVGGALGAAIGSQMNDVVEGKADPEDVFEAAKAGEVDAYLTLGGYSVAKALQNMGGGIARGLGITAEFAEPFIQAAQKYGARLGVFDASKFPFYRKIKNVAGVIPWLSAPFKRGRDTLGTEAKRLLDETIEAGGDLNHLAPNEALSDLGIDMVKAAEGAHEQFRRQSTKMYQSADKQARLHGAVVPAQPIRDVAERLLKTEFPATAKGTPDIERAKPPSEATQVVDEFIDSLRGIEAKEITVPELRSIQREVSRLQGIDKALGNSNNARLYQLSSTLKETMEAMAIPGLRGTPGEATALKQVQGLYADANAHFANHMQIFETPAAQTLSRVDQNLWNNGFANPGMLEPDQVAKQVMKFESPQFMDDLAAVVGKDNVAKAARLHFADAAQSARSVDNSGSEVFDFTKMFRSLGEEGTKVDPRALQAALPGAPIEELTQVVRMLERLGRVPNVAQFLTRKVAIGGSVGAAAAGVSMFGAMPAAASLSVLAMTRGALEVFNSPGFLKAVVRASDTNTPFAIRQAQYTRAVSMIFREEPLTPKERIDARMNPNPVAPDIGPISEADQRNPAALQHLMRSETPGGKAILKVHEDPLFGKAAPTIGHGTNLATLGITWEEAKDLEITDRQAEVLLNRGLRIAGQDVEEILDARQIPLEGDRRDVVVEMAYNMGKTSLSGFNQMFAALKQGDYDAAAKLMLTNSAGDGPSKWLQQVGKRAERLASVMQSGSWETLAPRA